MDITTYEIIQRIKQRRTDLKLSYQDLADRTGLSKSTLQRYETGDIANIPLSKIEVLAKGLETTPQYIMGWEPAKKSKKSASAARLENSELTPEEDRQIDDFINYILDKRKKDGSNS